MILIASLKKSSSRHAFTLTPGVDWTSKRKEKGIKDIKDVSIKIAIDSVKKIITTSVDKSKLDTLFQKNLDETKEELKKINL